jgi:hypothetical protein
MPTARSTPAQNEGATVNEVRARVEDEVARRESIASASTAAKDMKLLTPGLASSASHPAPAAPAMRAETVRRLMAQRLSRLEDEAKTKTEPAAQTAATKNDALALAEVDANGPEARGGSARVRAYTMDKSVPEQQLALRSVRDGDGYVAPAAGSTARTVATAKAADRGQHGSVRRDKR